MGPMQPDTGRHRLPAGGFGGYAGGANAQQARFITGAEGRRSRDCLAVGVRVAKGDKIGLAAGADQARFVTGTAGPVKQGAHFGGKVARLQNLYGLLLQVVLHHPAADGADGLAAGQNQHAGAGGARRMLRVLGDNRQQRRLAALQGLIQGLPEIGLVNAHSVAWTAPVTTGN